MMSTRASSKNRRTTGRRPVDLVDEEGMPIPAPGARTPSKSRSASRSTSGPAPRRGRRSESSRARTGNRLARSKAIRRRWVALLSVLTVAVGVYIVFFTSFLGVSSVAVTGTQNITVEQVQVAAAVPQHMALYRVDTDRVRDRILKLPGIATAEVSRSWPSTIKIAVTERVASMFYERGDGVHLVDNSGFDFKTIKEKPSGIPQIKVAEVRPNDPCTQAVAAVLAALPQALRTQLAALGAATPAGVELYLTDGKLVRWGTTEQIERKAKVLSALLTREGQIYDVSSPELPTVS